MNNEKRITAIFELLLPSLLALALYFQVVGHDYISFDDPGYTFENPMIARGLTLEGVRWAFADSHLANYHPFTWISHMFDFSLLGNAPGLFAFENALIHVFNTLLATLLFAQIFGDRRLGILGGLIFGAHPLLIESVAWISQRKTLCSSFWALVSLYSYLGFKRAEGGMSFYPRVFLYLSSILCFYVSLFFKTMYVTLPAMLLFLELMVDKDGKRLGSRISISYLRQELWPALTRWFPFLLGSLTFAVVSIWSQAKGGAVSEIQDYAIAERLQNVVVGYSSYLSKFFNPTNLSIFYPFDPGIGMADILVRGGALLAVSGVLYVYRKPLGLLPLLGWLFFLVSLLPVIGLVQIGAQSYADRYMYGPIIGLIILVVSTVHHFLDSVEAQMRRILVSGMLIWVLFLGIVGFFQIGKWKNDFTIARSILAFDPVNPIAADLMASSLIKYGHYEEAIEIVQQQIEIYPLNYTNYGKLALCLFLTDQREEALAYQQKFIEMNPRKGAGLLNMVKFLVAMGERERALDILEGVETGSYELQSTEIRMLRVLSSELRVEIKEKDLK